MVLVNVDLPRAFASGNIDAVNELIANGHPLNEPDTYGKLPLTEAAKSLGTQPKVKEEIVKLLLVAGADINAQDGFGRSALAKLRASRRLSLRKRRRTRKSWQRWESARQRNF